MVRSSAMILLFLLAVLTGGAAHAQDPPPSDTDAEGLLDAVADLADPLVRIKATQIGDGLVRNGEWAALHVRLDNLGDAVIGELIATTRTIEGETRTYRREVELAAGARKEVRFLYKPGIGGQTQRIDFMAGRRSVGADVPLRWVSSDEVAIGVIGDDAAGLGVLNATWSGRVPARAPMPSQQQFGQPLPSNERTVHVGLVPVAQVPDRAQGLDVFNELVWLDADPTGLSPEQAAALRAWVAGGGHLLLSVTERWRQVGQGPLADMLPVELSGVRDGGGASKLIGRGPEVIGPQGVARPRAVDGRHSQVLIADGPDAIWTVGTYGLGTVHVLAVDPRLEPLKSGVPRETLWRELLWLPPAGADAGWFYRDRIGEGSPVQLDRTTDLVPDELRLHPDLLAAMDLTAPNSGLGHDGYGDGQGTDAFGEADEDWFGVTTQFLKDIPGVAPIPMTWLLGFATVYLLVIGPLDYIVLRLLRRQTLTWITFPLSIVLFSVLALVGIGYVKGSQAVVTRYEVVDVLPGTSLWRGSSWYGVWSTRSTSLTMTSGKGDGLAEIVEGAGFKEAVETVHSTAGSALGWNARTWTLAYVRTTWTAPGTGGFSAKSLGDGSIEVRNDSGLDLTDVQVVVGRSVADLDQLRSGDTVRVRPDQGYVGTRPYPDEVLELVDLRSWAVLNAVDYPEARRGHLDFGEWDLVVVGATTGPIEDSVLDGLTPSPRTLTVVRAPLLLRQGGS